MASQQLPNSKNINTFTSPGGSSTRISQPESKVTPFQQFKPAVISIQNLSNQIRNSIGGQNHGFDNELRQRERMDTNED